MLSRRAALGWMAVPIVGVGGRSFAQQAGAQPIVGLLRLGPQTSEVSWVNNLRQGLKDNGLIEGSNVRLAARYADNQADRLVDLARELVKEGSRVIVASGTTSVAAAQRGAPDTAIVMAGSADPVIMGFAQSLARPGGRITGISIYGAEIIGKQVQILKEAVPGMRSFAAFLQASNPGNPIIRRNIGDAAEKLGLRLAIRDIEGAGDIGAAFDWVAGQSVDALHVIPDQVFAAHTRTIFKLAIDHRLPTMTGGGGWVRSGALLTYTVDFMAIAHRSAYYVKEILHGANPATMPIEQPTKVLLEVNMATARTLGLQIPSTLLARADNVVE